MLVWRFHFLVIDPLIYKTLDIEHKNIRAQIQARVPRYSSLVLQDLIPHIYESVLRPLARYGGFEVFHGQLISYMHEGLLQSVREVEILLKFDGKPWFDGVGQSAYQGYCDEVTAYCDALMQKLDPGWRHKHYIEELGKILVAFQESSSRHGGSIRYAAHQLGHRGKAVENLTAQLDVSPISTVSSTTIFTPDPSPSASVGWSFSTSSTSLGADAMATASHQLSSLPSPVELSAYSSSKFPSEPSAERLENASSPTPVPSAVAGLRCEFCGQVFTGKPRDQKTNLKRHIKNSHDREFEHICPEPNCGRAFNRSDYLNNHLRKHHHQSIRKTTRQSKKKPSSS